MQDLKKETELFTLQTLIPSISTGIQVFIIWLLRANMMLYLLPTRKKKIICSARAFNLQKCKNSRKWKPQHNYTDKVPPLWAFQEMLTSPFLPVLAPMLCLSRKGIGQFFQGITIRRGFLEGQAAWLTPVAVFAEDLLGRYADTLFAGPWTHHQRQECLVNFSGESEKRQTFPHCLTFCSLFWLELLAWQVQNPLKKNIIIYLKITQ